MGHRFFAHPDQVSGTAITLDQDESHHLTHVLRLGPGACIGVFDGHGHEYQCEVEKTAARSVELRIISEVLEPVESPLRIVLAQAVIRSDKFDWVIQKATELGVTSIVPVMTQYSEVRRTDAARLKRWQRISMEALKQSGRRRFVELNEPVSWDQFCREDTSPERLLFSERGGRELNSVPGASSVSVAIGPEGGWSEGDLKVAEAHQFVNVHLGPRILRSETAAVSAITLVQHLFGDLR